MEILPEKLAGRVVDRNLMFVVLREDDGAALQIPNNLFFQKVFRVTEGSNRPRLETPEPHAGVSREHALPGRH